MTSKYERKAYGIITKVHRLADKVDELADQADFERDLIEENARKDGRSELTEREQRHYDALEETIAKLKGIAVELSHGADSAEMEI